MFLIPKMFEFIVNLLTTPKRWIRIDSTIFDSPPPAKEFIKFEEEEDNVTEVFRDFILNRIKDYLKISPEKVANQELRTLIETFLAEESLTSSLNILKEIPKDLMYSLILEEIRQNPSSKNIAQFVKKFENVYPQ